MAIEKLKKIIFISICIVLVASVGVVAYAAWDDVTGKKTGDLGVNTGNNTILSCGVDDSKVKDMYLVPFGTTNFVPPTTDKNNVEYFVWTLTPNLNDLNKIDPVTKTKLGIFYKSLKIEIKNESNVIVLDNDDTTTAAPDLGTMFTYWLSTTEPVVTKDKDDKNTLVKPLPAECFEPQSFLTNGTYYFVIKFTKPIDADNVKYVKHTIDIQIDLEAKGGTV